MRARLWDGELCLATTRHAKTSFRNSGLAHSSDLARRLLWLSSRLALGGTLSMVTTVFRNVRHAVRVLARAPGFSLTAIATLALGIGAATAMFTIVNSVLLQPLPFREADRVAAIYTRYDPESGYDFPEFTLSGPEFLDYRAQARVLEAVAGY